MQRVEAAWLGQFDSGASVESPSLNLLEYEREDGLGSPSVSSLHIRPSRQTSLQEGYRKIYQNFFLLLAIET